jgi:hypothetical protein
LRWLYETLNSFFILKKISFERVKMVGILRKALQLLKLVRGPALKVLVPVLDAVMPGLGSAASFVGNEVVDRAERVHDAYDKAKDAGEKFTFMDGMKSLLGPGPPKPTAMSEKTKDYGELHPRLHLKGEEEDI